MIVILLLILTITLIFFAKDQGANQSSSHHINTVANRHSLQQPFFTPASTVVYWYAAFPRPHARVIAHRGGHMVVVFLSIARRRLAWTHPFPCSARKVQSRRYEAELVV